MNYPSALRYSFSPFSPSFFCFLLLRLSFTVTYTRNVFLSLSLSTYTPLSSRWTTGIISVFPQTRLTRNVVQQTLRAFSTGRDILQLLLVSFLHLSYSLSCLLLSFSLSFFGFQLDSISRRLIIQDYSYSCTNHSPYRDETVAVSW